MAEEKHPKEEINPARRKDPDNTGKPKKDGEEADVKGFQKSGVDPLEPGGINE